MKRINITSLDICLDLAVDSTGNFAPSYAGNVIAYELRTRTEKRCRWED